MPKDIDHNLQEIFAITPQGARHCPRGICRRTRRCLPPPAEKLLYRCILQPESVWRRHRRKILDIAKRIYWERDAAEMAANKQQQAAAKGLGRQTAPRP